MFVYVKYACCGGKRVSYVGQSSQDVSLALDASGAGQSHLGCSTRVWTGYMHTSVVCRRTNDVKLTSP